MITVETYYICSVDGCTNFVMEEMFKDIGCAVHGDTFVETHHSFENGKLVDKWIDVAPPESEDSNE